MSGWQHAHLVVLSHVRWDWVWQRPQHLVSRLGAGRALFVEEPRTAEVEEPRLHVEDSGPVRRAWLEVPRGSEPSGWSTPECALVPSLLEAELSGGPRDVWLYAPTAIPVAEALAPRLLVYDVMDDLAAFAAAPPEMRLRMREALDVADVVFTGGRSLHATAASVRGENRTHLFASGVECDHYARSRALRRSHDRPVAGYVGVLDERLDLALLAELAAALPDWDLHLVGPTAKIEPASLPTADNIRYLGMQPYERLPELMAAFDVALVPFARNEATRSLSPTKTLEYLAAGLPVVSTEVADVVADWGDVVHLAATGAQFAAACRHVVDHSVVERDARVAPGRRRYEWDSIAAGMLAVLETELARRAVARPKADIA